MSSKIGNIGHVKVVVDGTNLACEGIPDGRPSATQLTEQLDSLRSKFPTARIHVFLDNNTPRRAPKSERERLGRIITDGHRDITVSVVASGQRADDLILRSGHEENAIVVSNDGYREYHDQHPWILDDGRLLGAVKGMDTWLFEPRNPQPANERRKRVNKRSYAQVPGALRQLIASEVNAEADREEWLRGCVSLSETELQSAMFLKLGLSGTTLLTELHPDRTLGEWSPFQADHRWEGHWHVDADGLLRIAVNQYDLHIVGRKSGLHEGYENPDSPNRAPFFGAVVDQKPYTLNPGD